MDLFRKQPNLCSLFLSLLEEWGADTLDWSLLRDEKFVDRFLRRLLATQQVEDSGVFQACSSLLQPSPGGLLVAPLLVRGGHFEAAEMDSFVQFAVEGQARGWEPVTWPELLTILEEVAFTRKDQPSRFLACLVANGWVPAHLQERFCRRVWETARLSLREKNFFFAWLAGESRWADLPSPQPGATEHQRLRIGSRLSQSMQPWRRGISPSGKEAIA
jgi:hypothetical protein